MSFNLIHGDCFEEMQQMINKDIKYDLILTDPPYNVFNESIAKGLEKIGKNTMNLRDAAKWDGTKFNIEQYLKLCCSILKPKGRLVIFSSGSFTVRLYQIIKNIKQLNYSDEITWIKNGYSNPLSASKNLAHSTENITIFSKNGVNGGGKNNGKLTFNKLPFQNSNKNWFMINKEHKSYHTSQKPVKLLKNLIYIYSNKGDNILDPTSGSGSTIIAGLKLGRNVTGIEKEQKYCNITMQRVNELKQHKRG